MTEGHDTDVRHHFDDELDEIRRGLVDLGMLVVENLRHAGLVMLENRLDEVAEVKQADKAVNAGYEDLEQRVFQILALQQPVATDLRFLVAATRILYELERSGDLAVNIVKQLRRLDGLPPDPALHAILGQLVDASSAMFGRGVEAIASMDPNIGIVAESEDETTDQLTSDLFSAVTARQDSLGLEASVGMFYVGRFLERIADHGVNIAQNVTFVTTGAFPEDD
jgi:phosphate transport system protein